MGPFLLLNAALVGFFGFASIYHLILWGTSRRETLLAIFGVDCAMRAMFCGVIMGIATSESIAEAQANLHARIAIGMLIFATWVWCLSLIADVDARRFVWPITIVFLLVFIVHVFIVSLNSRVIALEPFVLPWGETVVNPRLAPPGWWFAPMYAVVISVEMFGYYCVLRLWSRDRIAGMLILLATSMLLAMHVVHILRAFGLVDFPLVGTVGHALWACMVGLVIARRHLQMNERLAASERRFRGVFDQTFQFIGLLSTDGRLIEANRTALQFAGVREVDVIGKPFWQSPWWTHSPKLQDQLKQAIRDAAAGQTVRFEADHCRPDGGVAQVDFSLKPLRNERGEITLLIPEGRDISERKKSEVALQQRVDELTILNRVGEICSRANSPDELLHQVTQVFAAERYRDNFGFLLLDSARGVLVTHPSFVLSEPGVSKADKPLGVGITGQVAMTGQAKRLGDVRQDSGYLAADSRTRSEMCLPMRVGDHVVGVLNVESQQLDAFTEAEEQLLSTVVDIVGNAIERLRAEERIRESQQLLSSVSQALPNWIYIFDFDVKGMVYTNRSLRSDLGYSLQECDHENSMESLSKLIASENQNHLKRLLEEWQALPDGQLRDDVYEFRHADGATRSFAGREIVFARRADGTVRQILGSIADITMQRRAEDLLRESEERFRAFVEHGFEGINIVDAQGTLVYAGPGNKSLLGYSAESVVGRSAFETLHPDDLPHVKSTWVEILQHPESLFRHRLRALHEDGTWRWMEVSACNLLHHRAVGGIVVNWQDITDRKNAEDKLHESEERKAAIFESALDALITIDGEGKIVEWNPAAESIFGFTEQQVIGRVMGDLIIPPRLREAHRQGIEQLLVSGEGRVIRKLLELPAMRADGSEFPAEVYITPIRNESPLFSGFVRDITERKQAEQERRKLEAQILHSQKLESLGVLAGGIAHDFNNLLTVMLGNASLAQMKLPADSQASSLVHEIEQAARRASELTQQMLAYSGKGKFVIERLRLDNLVHDTTNLLNAVISKKAVLKLQLEPATIEGDGTQVRQLAMNLVINASDALEGKAGEIEIRTGVRFMHSEELRSPYLPDDLPAGEYSFLEVADTGCGMSEETQARIFDPFFTTKFAGRGLGLAAVLGIVRGHRGTIQLQSAPGKGTAFQVMIPVASSLADNASEIRRSDSKPNGKGTILVFDDEPTIHSFIRNVLEDVGFEVLTAENGPAGLKLLMRHSPAVVAVLLDLTMPFMDGLEVLQELRNLSPTVPVLVMSGYNDQDVAIRCAGSGASGFIQKPFDPRNLIERLCEILPAESPDQ